MAIVGSNQVVIGGVEYAWYARRDTNGIPAGITGTLSNGADVGFRRVKGFTQLAETVPAVTFLPVIGDNGVIATITQKPLEPVTADFGLIVFDQTMTAALDNRTVYTVGAWEISQSTLKCGTLQNGALILNGRAISQESGTVGQEGWWTRLYYNVKGKPTGGTMSGTSAEALEQLYSLTMAEVDTLWWEESVATNYGVSYTYASDYIIADYPITCHRFKGDNSAVSFTVDETPSAASGNAVVVWIDGTKKTYTTDYTVTTATKTITLNAAPAAGADVFVMYEFVPSAC